MAATLIPRYQNDLAYFLGDLRSAVFSSQSKIARKLGLSHTTISRYENGYLRPPIGYVAYLAQGLEQRLKAVESDVEKYRILLLREVNEVVKWCYPDEHPYENWSELCKVAKNHLELQSAGKQAGEGRSKRYDWGRAPDVVQFYGRVAELADLENLIIEQACKIVVVMGMNGVGKTTLVTKLAHNLQSEFSYIIWRSLHNAPSLEQIVQEITQCLPIANKSRQAQSLDQQTLRLHEFLQTQRCLLVLDNLESIMHPGEYLGNYLPGYESYGVFFKSLASKQHQSCLVLTSRENLTDLNEMASTAGSTSIYAIDGLDYPAIKRLLEQWDLIGEEEVWIEFIQHYSGNPLALKLIADVIKEYFDGDIAHFLSSDSFMVADLRVLLDRSFQRLSTLARNILYLLAIYREPLSLQKISERIIPRVLPLDAVDALQSLSRCSLIENRPEGFFIQSFVSEYLIDRFLRQLHQEILDGKIDSLQQIPLLTTDSSVYVQETQVRFFLKPLIQILKNEYGEQGSHLVLKQLLEGLRAQTFSTPGYAAGNILNLMLHQGQELQNENFSGLPVWHAHLRGYSLPGVDFSDCDLSHSTFDSVFAGVTAIALSAEPRLLAIATGLEIRIWCLQTRQFLQILRGHSDLIWELHFGKDDRWLYSRGADNHIFRWDLDTGEVVTAIQDRSAPLRSMAVDNDGTIIATGNQDGTVCLWHADDGLRLHILSGGQSAVSALEFDGQGNLLLAGYDDGSITLWNRSGDKEISMAEVHQGSVTAVAFARGGEILVTGGADNAVRLWTSTDGDLLSTFTGHAREISALRCPSSGNTLISASYDRTARIWDIRNKEPLLVLRGHSRSVRSLDVDAKGGFVATGSYDRTVRLWDSRTGQLIDVIVGQTFEVRTLAFSPDGKNLAAGSTDYHVRIWELISGQRLHNFAGHGRWVASLAYHPTGDWLASSSYDRSLRVWNLRSGQDEIKIADHTHWVLCVSYDRDGRLLASGGVDRIIRLWSTDDYRLVFALHGHSGAVNCLSYNTQGDLLASGSNDQSVCLWRTESGELSLKLLDHNSPVTGLIFVPEQNHLLSRTSDNHIFTWDSHTGELIRKWHFAAGEPYLTAFGPQGKILAGYSNSGNRIHVWNLSSEELIWEFNVDRGRISALAFDQQGLRLASGSLDGQITVWNVETGEKTTSMRINQPYAGMNITAATGLSAVQVEMLKALGAVEDEIAQ